MLVFLTLEAMTDNYLFQTVWKETRIDAQLMGYDLEPPKIEIYKPGQKGGIPLTGYVSDFYVVAFLPDHRELILPVPSVEDVEEKKANDEYNFAKRHDSAMLEVFIKDDATNTTTLIDKIALWCRYPLYRASLLERFTSQSSLVIPPGKSLLARIANPRNDFYLDNDGIKQPVFYTDLHSDEYVNILVKSYEEGAIQISDLADLTQRFYTLKLENPHTEYSFSLPDGCQGYAFKCRGDVAVGDTITPVRYSWQPGKVTGTEGYDILPENSEEGESYIPPLTGKTFYFSSPVATTLTIKILEKN